MAHKQHRPAFVGAHGFHFAEAFFLELSIAYGQHFIYNQNLGFEVGGYCKAEANVHAAAVAFYRGVDVAFYPGKVNDFVKLAGDFFFGHAEDGPVEVDVFAAGKVGVKAGAYFEQAGYPAPHGNAAGSGFGDAAQQFEQGAFAGAVAANDAEHFAGLYTKVDVFQCPYILTVTFLAAVVAVANGEERIFFTPDAVPPAFHIVFDGAGAYLPEAVLLAEVFYLYDGSGQGDG